MPHRNPPLGIAVRGPPCPCLGVRASDVNLSSPTAATIVSINEIVQVEHKIMAKFGTYGIGPDADVTLVTNDDGLVITSAKGELTVPPELGHAIRIRIREA